MFLSEKLLETIQLILFNKTSVFAPVKIVEVVSGGCINSCYKLEASGRYYFLKVNSTGKFPGMLRAEADGLKRIQATHTVRVPQIVADGTAGDEQYLLLPWLETGKNNKEAQEELGRKLADLHRNSEKAFGLDYDNYIGSLPQKNRFHDNWTNFFIAERLEPQLELALGHKLLDREWYRKFQLLFGKLDDLYPAEKPALLHGDFWSGNYMIDKEGTPVIFDPAIAYGNREADISMTALFAGFDNAFYNSYDEYFPLSKGWKDRLDLWNLYPLLVHLNLFGSTYASQLKKCLLKYL